jgi:tRNA dimethylallyltransferase
MANKKPVIFIIGPTAIGKTRLAIRLAKKVRGEVISADSMQVYKGMRILSQAPAAGERKGIPHHLIEILSPDREYSAASFRRRASLLITAILNKGNIPLVTGGSGLYVKVLIDGLFRSPAADPGFREKMMRYISRHGSEKAHERLSGIDPDSAQRIHPNDSRRIIRALEVYHSTGRTMTELKAGTRGIKDRYEVMIFGLTAGREKVYSNINERVERMFREGAIKEVKRLKTMPLSKTAKAVLGFMEISACLDGDYGPDEAKELLRRNTRRFAKRQMTWFRADGRIEWLDSDRLSETEMVRRIRGEIKRRSH